MKSIHEEFLGFLVQRPSYPTNLKSAFSYLLQLKDNRWLSSHSPLPGGYSIWLSNNPGVFTWFALFPR
jgi:hypothetical protein